MTQSVLALAMSKSHIWDSAHSLGMFSLHSPHFLPETRTLLLMHPHLDHICILRAKSLVSKFQADSLSPG